MNRDQSLIVVKRMLTIIKDTADEESQVRICAKVLRDMVNKLPPDEQELEIERLRKQIVDLNTKILHMDGDINKRVYRNVELVRENRNLKSKVQ